jgi:hypothetical protein
MCKHSFHRDSDDGNADSVRRDFLKTIAMAAAGLSMATTRSAAATPPEASPASPGPSRLFDLAKPLKVKPVLVYHLYERQEGTTWREWGGLKTEQDVDREATKIAAELSEMSGKAGFKIDMMPLERVHSEETLKQALAADGDLYLVYGAGAGGPGLYSFQWIEALADSGKPNVMFLRHKSGPVSLLYETVHPYFLRKGKDEFVRKNLTIDDVVVDDYGQVLWRLRAWRGLLATKGAKIVAVGGPGSGGLPHECPASAKGTWNLDIITVADEQLKERISRAHADAAAVDLARRQMREYLQDGVVSVEAKAESIHNAFLLANVLMDVMRENGAGAVTIRNCMCFGPVAGTTPCLAFSLINDTGRMAFCEADFSAIPAGMLLANLSGKPVFLNDPTFPHDGVTTCAHCSCARRLDGANLEPVKILTHCESDYGAAPKVLFRKGQRITSLVASFAGDHWVGFTGTITDHPSYDVCRSQLDCTIDGDWKRLRREMRGFHWITGYGQYLDEIGYALGKVGVRWVNVSG